MSSISVWYNSIFLVCMIWSHDSLHLLLPSLRRQMLPQAVVNQRKHQPVNNKYLFKHTVALSLEHLNIGGLLKAAARWKQLSRFTVHPHHACTEKVDRDIFLCFVPTRRICLRNAYSCYCAPPSSKRRCAPSLFSNISCSASEQRHWLVSGWGVDVPSADLTREPRLVTGMARIWWHVCAKGKYSLLTFTLTDLV